MIEPRDQQDLPLSQTAVENSLRSLTSPKLLPFHYSYEEKRFRGASYSSKLNRSVIPHPAPSQPCPVTAWLLSFV